MSYEVLEEARWSAGLDDGGRVELGTTFPMPEEVVTAVLASLTRRKQAQSSEEGAAFSLLQTCFTSRRTHSPLLLPPPLSPAASSALFLCLISSACTSISETQPHGHGLISSI